MSSQSSSLIRKLLKVQRVAQRRASIETIRRISPWIERLFSVPKDVRWEKISHGELAYEWLTPERLTTSQVLFHIHGGGFVLPLYNPERSVFAHLARISGARMLFVDYRLAPENPFPAALEDCIAAYRWLIQDEGVSPEEVVFTGDSAGGNLVVTTLLNLRDSGSILPAAGVAICPVFEFEGLGTFYTQDDPMALADFTMMQLSAYRGNTDPHTPLLSPLYADLHDLPPLLVQVGEHELFRSGAEAFVARAEEARVDIELRIWPEMWHFWHMFIPWLPESLGALEEIKDFVSSHRLDQDSDIGRPNHSLEQTPPQRENWTK